MFDIVGHRNWVISQLYAFTQILFVPNNGPRPEKPFVAYTIIAPYIPQEAPPVIQYSDIVKPIEPESRNPDQPEVVINPRWLPRIGAGNNVWNIQR